VRSWALLLGGLIAWAAQFFVLYIVASVLGSTLLARAIAVAVTLAALAADAAILMRAVRRRRESATDRFGRWLASLALLIAGTSAIAIVWQGLPALMV
jgi:hypothetical protein